MRNTNKGFRLLAIAQREPGRKLAPGGIAGLIFLVRGFQAELMWVYIEDRTDKGVYIGTLDDIPMLIPPGILKQKDTVHFTADNIVTIWKER